MASFASRAESYGTPIMCEIEIWNRHHSRPDTHTLTLAGDPLVIETKGDRDDILSAVLRRRAVLSILTDEGMDEVAQLDDAKLGDVIMTVRYHNTLIWAGVYACQTVQQSDTLARNVVQLEFIDAMSYLYYVPYTPPAGRVRISIRDVLESAWTVLNAMLPGIIEVCYDDCWTVYGHGLGDVMHDSRLGTDAEEHSIGSVLENICRYWGLTMYLRDYQGLRMLCADRNPAIDQRRRWRYSGSAWVSRDEGEWNGRLSPDVGLRYDSVTVSRREVNTQSTVTIKRDWICQQNVTEACHALDFANPAPDNDRWFFYDPSARRPVTGVVLNKYASRYFLGEFRVSQSGVAIDSPYVYLRSYSSSYQAQTYYYYGADTYAYESGTYTVRPQTIPSEVLVSSKSFGADALRHGIGVYQLSYALATVPMSYDTTPMQWTKAIAIINSEALYRTAHDPAYYMQASDAVAMASAPMVAYKPWLLKQDADYTIVGTAECTLKIEMSALMVDPLNVSGLPTGQPHDDGDWRSDQKADSYAEVVPFCACIEIVCDGETWFWSGISWVRVRTYMPLVFEPRKYGELFDSEITLRGMGKDKGLLKQEMKKSPRTSGSISYDYEPADVMEGIEIPLDDLPADFINVEDIKITIGRPGPYAVDASGRVVGTLGTTTSKIASAVYITRFDVTLLSQVSAVKKSLLDAQEPRMQADVRHIIGDVNPLRKAVGVDEQSVRYGVWEPFMDPSFSTMTVGGEPVRTGSCSYQGLPHDLSEYDSEIVRLLRAKQLNSRRQVIDCTMRFGSTNDNNFVSFSDKPASDGCHWVVVESERHLRSNFMRCMLRQVPLSAVDPIEYTVETESRVSDYDASGGIAWDYNIRSNRIGVARK